MLDGKMQHKETKARCQLYGFARSHSNPQASIPSPDSHNVGLGIPKRLSLSQSIGGNFGRTRRPRSSRIPRSECATS